MTGMLIHDSVSPPKMCSKWLKGQQVAPNLVSDWQLEKSTKSLDPWIATFWNTVYLVSFGWTIASEHKNGNTHPDETESPNTQPLRVLMKTVQNNCLKGLLYYKLRERTTYKHFWTKPSHAGFSGRYWIPRALPEVSSSPTLRLWSFQVGMSGFEVFIKLPDAKAVIGESKWMPRKMIKGHVYNVKTNKPQSNNIKHWNL